MLKVSPQVATPAAESAVYDCLVFTSFLDEIVSTTNRNKATAKEVSLQRKRPAFQTGAITMTELLITLTQVNHYNAGNTGVVLAGKFV